MYQSSKGASPIEILTGWKPCNLLSYADSSNEQLLGHVFATHQDLWTAVSESIEKAELSQINQYNKKRTSHRFAKGYIVLLELPR